MHHSYVIPGVVDKAVVDKQAHARANDARHPESTSVHMHRHGDPCNKDCYLITVAKKEDEDAAADA